MIEEYYKQFRKACDEYFVFDDERFEKLKDITFFKEIKKGEILLDNYSKAKYIYILFAKEFYELTI